MLPPKNESVNKKSPEIRRFIEFMDGSGLKPFDISEKTGVPLRTIQNTIWRNLPIGGRLLRDLHSKYSISVDWLLSGIGNMFVHEEQERPPIYSLITNRYSEGVTMEPLITDYQHTDPETLQDIYWLIAKCIEQSLIQSGAVPGEDYTRLDLYKLAQPHVLAECEKSTIKIQIMD